MVYGKMSGKEASRRGETEPAEAADFRQVLQTGMHICI